MQNHVQKLQEIRYFCVSIGVLLRLQDFLNPIVRAYLFLNLKIYFTQGPEGSRLMHKLAVKTTSLIPKHTWVPWIIIDGVFRQDYQDQAVENLLKLICKLSNGPQPAECI